MKATKRRPVGGYKLTVRINKKYNNLLEDEKRLKKRTKARIIEAALEAYFAPDKEEERISAIGRRLVTLDRSINNLSDSTKVIGELFTAFVKTWMLHNPELVDNKKKALTPQMLKRHENLLQLVVKNISEHKTLFDFLPGAAKIAAEAEFISMNLENKDKKEHE